MLPALGIREAAERLRQLALRKPVHRGGLLSDLTVVVENLAALFVVVFSGCHVWPTP
jgi:hypothetical protein